MRMMGGGCMMMGVGRMMMIALIYTMSSVQGYIWFRMKKGRRKNHGKPTMNGRFRHLRKANNTIYFGDYVKQNLQKYYTFLFVTFDTYSSII